MNTYDRHALSGLLACICCLLSLLESCLFGIKTVIKIYEPVHEKTNSLGFRPGQHKPDCIITEDCQKLEILYLESRGIILSI